MTAAIEAVLAAGGEQVAVTAGRVLAYAVPAVMTLAALAAGVRRLARRRQPLRVVRIVHAPAEDDWEPGWDGDDPVGREADEMARRYGHG